MPKVNAYKGTISLVGTDLWHGKEELLRLEENVYAESTGALLEQFKSVSVRFMEKLEIWLTTMPDDYDMEKDHWFLSCSYPSLLNDEEEMGHGSSVDNPIEILRSIIYSQYLEITGAMRSLDRKNFDLVGTPKEFTDAMYSNNIQRMINAGIRGSEFDEWYSKTETQKLLKEYNDEIKMARMLRERRAKDVALSIKAEEKSLQKAETKNRKNFGLFNKRA